jgi:hypothetical protein
MVDKGENSQMLQGCDRMLQVSDLMIHMIVKGEIHAVSIHMPSEATIR